MGKGVYTLQLFTSRAEWLERDNEFARVWLCDFYNQQTKKHYTATNFDNFLTYVFERGRLPKNLLVHVHNLKIIGNFIVSWLYRNNYKYLAILGDYSFNTIINNKNIWYEIKIKTPARTIKIHDAANIIPISLDKMIKKTGQDPIIYDDISYRDQKKLVDAFAYVAIKQQTEVIAEWVQKNNNEGFSKMTISANAMQAYKQTITPKQWRNWFPRLHPVTDFSCRQAYKGGICMINPRYVGQWVPAGISIDKKSMYAYIMQKYRLPFGRPIYFEGEYKKDSAHPYFIQHCAIYFNLKDGYLPFIQMGGGYYDYEADSPAHFPTSSGYEFVEMYLTNFDLDQIKKRYECKIEYINGYKFRAQNGMFAKFIDKYYYLKENADDVTKYIYKRILVGLYGKMGAKPYAQNKTPVLNNNDIIELKNNKMHDIKSFYVPLSIFVTSIARSIIINYAQHCGARFVYCDTDSLHLIGRDIPSCFSIGNSLEDWHIEKTFDKAKYLAPKTYMHVVGDKNIITASGLSNLTKEKTEIAANVFDYGLEFENNYTLTNVKGGCVYSPRKFSL